MCAKGPDNFTGTDLTTQHIVVSNTNHKSPPVTSCPLDSNIFLSILLSDTVDYIFPLMWQTKFLADIRLPTYNSWTIKKFPNMLIQIWQI